MPLRLTAVLRYLGAYAPPPNLYATPTRISLIGALGTVNGNELSWKVSITDPMDVTLEFTGAIEGGEMSEPEGCPSSQYRRA